MIATIDIAIIVAALAIAWNVGWAWTFHAWLFG